MDREGIEALVNGMTDEQIREFLQSVDKPQEQKPQEVSYKLSDGTELKAKDNEELTKILAAQLEEARRTPQKAEAPPAPVQPNQPPKWDYKTFSDKFVNDPREGLEYFEMANYGMPVGKTVPALVSAMTMLAQQVQQLQQEQFTTAVPEYKTPEARQAIDTIIRERGWQPTRQSLEDAFAIAKARGMVQEHKEEKPSSWVPPRTPRSGREDSGEMSTEEVIRRANEMKQEDLEALLIKSGMLKHGVR